MAVTIKGFQGTVSDTDMATQLGGHHLPTCRSAIDLQVTAVSGARRISISAGTADSAFVKVTSDAAIPIDLAPPTSGGMWYAITIDRQWSPTNSVTFRAEDLAAPTDGSARTGVPATVVSLAAAMQNQPGTAGSTGGQRQVLAVVYVIAASTALSVFDMRLFATGAGNVQAPSLFALQLAHIRHLRDGAVVAVGQHLMSSGGTHISSLWQRTGARLTAVGDITVDDSAVAGTGGAALTPATPSASMVDLTNLANNGLSPNLLLQNRVTRVVELVSASRWQWEGPKGKFLPYDWAYIPSGFSGASGASVDTNGGNSEAHLAAGVCTLNFNLYRSAGMGTNTAYAYTVPGLRPQYAIHGSGAAFSGNTIAAAFQLGQDGGIVLTGATSPSGSIQALRGTFQFRPFQ